MELDARLSAAAKLLVLLDLSLQLYPQTWALPHNREPTALRHVPHPGKPRIALLFLQKAGSLADEKIAARHMMQLSLQFLPRSGRLFGST